MDSRKLPINATPPLICKLRHAYPLSILSTDDAYLPWFYSNYIQLFCPRARGFPHATIDFYPPHYPSLPPLDVQLFDRRILHGSGGGRLHEFVIRCLDDELYVRLYVDEFHIPDRAAYRRAYMPHKLLLFGYDRRQACFDIMGFLPDGRYAPSRIGFADLEQAFHSSQLAADIQALELGKRDPALGNLAEIWLARLSPRRECLFDVRLVSEQLVDYLASKNTADRFRMLDTSYYAQEGSGMDIYSCIRRRLEYSLQHPDFCDFISLHVLWEHKKCMLARIKYMEDHLHLGPDSSLYEAYEEVEDQARILRMMMLRFGMQKDRNIIERVIERLAAMAEIERDLLERLVALLGE